MKLRTTVLPHSATARLFQLLLVVLSPYCAAAQAYGQYPNADTTQVYSLVEQMPSLPSGGGNLALVKAVQKQLQLPAEVREGRLEGRMFVRAVVGVSGVVRQATVAQSLSPACDAAALAATGAKKAAPNKEPPFSIAG